MPALTADHELERVAELLELGFDPEPAGRLARAVDVTGRLVAIHDIRAAIARGCPLDVAFRIFA
jgi:hypothetical protein